jgi:BMFP domain-containing protein YqiC
VGCVSFATDLDVDDREYDNWLTTLIQASERLDALEAAVTELRQACQTDDVHSDQVLEMLEKHGAISKAAHAPNAA